MDKQTIEQAASAYSTKFNKSEFGAETIAEHAFIAGAEFATPKWTSVSERLPQDHEQVLCLHYDSGNHFVCYRTTNCITKGPNWFGGSTPTHWMSIPSLIKPE